MHTRIPLGSSCLRIPPMGMGTAAWGDPLLWRDDRPTVRAGAWEAFRTALEHGIDFFDTAEVYGWGRTESLMGRFIRRSGSHPLVATKFMPFPFRLRRASLLRALRGSLARLEVDRVGLYQVHWFRPPRSIDAWMDAMAEAVDAGLIQAVGVSNCDAAQLSRAHEALRRRGVSLASIQVQYSLLDRGPERSGLLEACGALNVTLIAYRPLAAGLLCGRYSRQYPPPGIRRRELRPGWLERLAPLLDTMWEIGAAHGGRTPGQVALNWLMCKGAVPIPGAKNGAQALENLGALGWRLTAAEVAALDSVTG